MTTVALPTSANREQWNDDQRALLDFAGLVVRKKDVEPVWAPASVVAAFLQQCDRTGLDPIARQIYAIERGGKWTVQASIDGMRLVAQRSGQYRGQSAPQWTDGTRVRVPMRDVDGSIVRDGDGSIVWDEDYKWFDVWTGEGYPVAARVAVYKASFAGPVWGIARWDSYKVENDEWVYDPAQRKRVKTGAKELGPMWKKMPDLMLAKVAEALALRKAFPMDLSGLYTEEEMDGQDFGDEPRQTARRAPRVLDTVASRARAAAEQSEQATTPLETEAAGAGRTQPVVEGSGDEVPMFPCSECGRREAPEEGAICATCEDRIASEFEAAQAEVGK